VIKAGLIKLIT